MSFGGSKTPAVPVAPPAPTEEDMIAKRVAAGELAQREWARGRAASETNVGGKAQALEEQTGRGLLYQKRRAVSAEWGMNGTRG